MISITHNTKLNDVLMSFSNCYAECKTFKQQRTMKQTAVDYIKEKLMCNEYWYENMTFDQIIDQAKEMEKEQIIEFADEYGTYLLQGGTMSAVTYNETFNKSINDKG